MVKDVEGNRIHIDKYNNGYVTVDDGRKQTGA